MKKLIRRILTVLVLSGVLFTIVKIARAIINFLRDVGG